MVHVHKKVLAAVISVVVIVSIGTLVYHAIEGWSYVDSLYFTAITMTTIGYGDIAPTHDISKLFTVVFAFSGVGIFLFSMGIIAEYYFIQRVIDLEDKLKRHHKKDKEKIYKPAA